MFRRISPLKTFIVTLCLLLCLQAAGAAISFDVAVDLGNNGGTTNTLSHTFTVSAGDTFLEVCFDGDVGGGNDDITSVTFNTTTNLSLIQKQTGASTRLSYAYGVVNPPVTTGNIVINSTNNHFLVAGAATYKGTSITSQPEASNTGQSTAISPYLTSLTTLTNNAWVVMCNGSNQTVASTNCTSRASASIGAPPTWMMCDSNGPVTPAGSFSMSTTASPASAGNHIMFSLAPGTVTNTTMPPVVF